MTALPASSEFIASGVTEGQFKTALTALRDFLSGLLGADGLSATALATIGALGSGYVAKTTAYTVVAGDKGKVIDANGTWTLSLPAAATAGAGFSLAVRNGAAGIITIDPNAAELVNGATTALVAPGQTILLACTGAAWISLGAVGNDAGAFLAITGTALQASLVDSTVGVLLKVGAFGWGGNNLGVTTLSDLNANRVAGFQAWSSLVTGAPETAGVLLHIPRLAGVTVAGAQQQIAFGATGATYYRFSSAAGGWNPWVTIMQATAAGVLSLAGNAIGGQSLTIANNAVGIISVPRIGGFAAITCSGNSASPLPDYSGQVYFDAGTTLQIIKNTGFTGLSASLNVSTSDVTGTTGTAGFVTVAVQSSVLKIENRLGATRDFQVTFS
ncbi:hypothetical protein [Cypionkella sp. TWP1-2-1b2]|uniref:hypothetical protein n=1 Tax=Cypionkella sp. TWP1-2-1b2 TaxID=2804675 RepID=UPI003CF3A61D